MCSVNVSEFRSPTKAESAGVIQVMYREFWGFSSAALIWCGIMSIAGSYTLLRSLIEDSPFGIVITIVACILFLACVAFLLWQCILMKKQFLAVRDGSFDVLDCRIEKVLDWRSGYVAVRAVSGDARWEWLPVDAKTLQSFKRGEDPVVLLVRYAGDQLVLLSEKRLCS